MRYAACNALGQMANDFAPTLHKKFHDKVSTVFYSCSLCEIHVDLVRGGGRRREEGEGGRREKEEGEGGGRWREERGEGRVHADLSYMCVPLTTKIAIIL